MSRSYKKAIIKDVGFCKKIYWKTHRRIINSIISSTNISDLDEIVLPHPREIINDYSYSDYKIDYEYNKAFGYFWYNGNKNSIKKEIYRRK